MPLSENNPQSITDTDIVDISNKRIDIDKIQKSLSGESAYIEAFQNNKRVASSKYFRIDPKIAETLPLNPKKLRIE